MSRIAKLILGFLTIVPLIYIFGILLIFRDLPYDTIEKIHYVIMALYLGLLVTYVRDTRANDQLPDEKRNLWSALVVVGSSVAQIVYYVLYVWPDEER